MEGKKKKPIFLIILLIVIGVCFVFVGAQYLSHKEIFNLFNLKKAEKVVIYQKYDNANYIDNIGKRYGDIVETYKNNLKTPSISSNTLYIILHSMDERIRFYFPVRNDTTVLNTKIDKDDTCIGVTTRLGNLLGITDKSAISIDELRTQIPNLGEFYADHELNITVDAKGRVYTPMFIKGKYLNYNILIRNIDGKLYEDKKININSSVYIMKEKIDVQYLYND